MISSKDGIVQILLTRSKLKKHRQKGYRWKELGRDIKADTALTSVTSAVEVMVNT